MKTVPFSPLSFGPVRFGHQHVHTYACRDLHSHEDAPSDAFTHSVESGEEAPIERPRWYWLRHPLKTFVEFWTQAFSTLKQDFLLLLKGPQSEEASPHEHK